MAKPDENLSPEEKLLRVIQGGDDLGASEARTDGDGAEPTGDAVAPPAAAAPAVSDEPVAEKPKLKLAEQKAPAPAPEPPLTQAPPPEAASTSEPEGPETVYVEADGLSEEAVGQAPPRLVDMSAAPVKKGSIEHLGAIAVVNRCLAIGVLVVLAFTVFEVFSRASVPPPSVPPDPPRMEKRIEQFETPTRESLIGKFDTRDIFRPPRAPRPGTVENDNTPPGVIYIQRFVKVIGVSPLGEGKQEAIIVDGFGTGPGGKGKMLFLREGQAIPIMDESLKDAEAVLTSVTTDLVVFSVNGKEVKLQAGK